MKNYLNDDSKNSDEFYTKLVELKNEQKKHLAFMEELYNQKKQLKESIDNSEKNLNDIKSSTYPAAKADDDYKYRLNTVSAYENRSVIFDEEELEKLKSIQNERLSTGKPPPAPIKQTTVTFSKETLEANKKSNKLLESIDEDLLKIEQMWNDFDINKSSMDMKSFDFNRKFVKIKSPKVTTANRPQSATSVSWMPRVTIPEPFSMSIREQVKTDKKQQKLLREMQDEREKRIETEIRECKNKFKANPVPAHVYKPLYEKKKVDEEYRKQKLKAMSKEYSKKVSRPFNLTDTNKNSESKRQRRHSFSGEKIEKKVDFVAHPLPEFYYNEEELKEKLKEQELYKQIYKQMRALELLKQSKMPHNLELQQNKKLLEMERNEYFIQEMNRLQKELEDKEGIKNNRKTHEIPDYDELYRKFVIEMENKKNMNRKSIKAEPFVLLAASRTRAKNNLDNTSQTQMSRSSSMSRLSKKIFFLNFRL